MMPGTPAERAARLLAKMPTAEHVIGVILDTEDVEYLLAIQDAELHGKGRVTIQRHILRRLAELRGER